MDLYTQQRNASREATTLTNEGKIPSYDLLMKCSKEQLSEKLIHHLKVIEALREMIKRND